VRDLIASKAKGGEIVAPPSAERPPVTDLMAALKASLGANGGSRKDGARTTPRRAAHSARSRRSNGANRAHPAQRSKAARAGAHR
jgi:non-homologous end joining protein Ku